MSLGFIYVSCQDGKYYKNLTYWDKRLNWFICLNDNEPVERIIRKSPNLLIFRLSIKRTVELDPQSILTRLGIQFNSISRPYKSKRIFTKDKGKLQDALCYFVYVKGTKFPKPRSWDTYDSRLDAKTVGSTWNARVSQRGC